MYGIILSAILEMFKALIPVISKKLNEPKTATDAPPVPRDIHDAWMRGW